MNDCLYHEAHVTVEPVFGPELEQFKVICKAHKFKAAELLMQKEREATPERSSKDTFCTGHGAGNHEGRIDIECRLSRLVEALDQAGFKVWREKIEMVVHDLKYPR